jgi:hypothetical protein
MKNFNLILIFSVCAVMANAKNLTSNAINGSQKLRVITKSVPKESESRQEILATLKLESENTKYKIIQTLGDRENALLERTSAKLANKTIKIPKGLAQHIKSDLLALTWQARYKPSRVAASNCDLAATVMVDAEDTVKICQNQLKEISQALEIQKQLNDLISSRK